MIDDLDIFRAADVPIKRHGADAAIDAARRADELLAAGDLEGCALWKRILAAVLELTRTTPAQAHVCRVLRPGMTVLDVGARAGFYTLALASRVGSSGRVIAIEADAENVRRLRWHLALNRVTNAQVVEAVACDHDGMVRFGDGSYLGHLDDSGAAVPAIRLDDLGYPDAIKLDIGGAEGAALAGAARILERGHAHIFLALYGIWDELALVLLQEHGYRLDWLGLDELHAIPPH